MSVAEELQAIAAIGDQKTKSEQYKVFLDRLVSQGDVAGCRHFVDHGEQCGLYCRPLHLCRSGPGQPWRAGTAPAARRAPPGGSPRTRPARRLLPAAVLSDAVPLVLSRQLLLSFAQSLKQMAPELQQAVAV